MSCEAPDVHARLHELCFNLDTNDEDRRRLEAHLLVCNTCWAEFQRLSEAVHLLRSDYEALRPVMAADVIELTGLGERLSHWLGGHAAFGLAISAVFGSAMALALLIEVAYQWNAYWQWALPISLVIAAGSGTVLTFGLDRLRRRRLDRGQESFGRTAVILVGWTILIAASVVGFLPSESIVEASIQTMPARLAWFKGVSQALHVPLLALLPFHFVLAVQAELRAGRAERVARFLSRDRSSVSPQGALFVPPTFIGLVAGVLALYWLVATAHLLDNLMPGANTGLFMSLVIGRVAIVCSGLVVLVAWYARVLEDLKREAIAVSSGRTALTTH